MTRHPLEYSMDFGWHCWLRDYFFATFGIHIIIKTYLTSTIHLQYTMRHQSTVQITLHNGRKCHKCNCFPFKVLKGWIYCVIVIENFSEMCRHCVWLTWTISDTYCRVRPIRAMQVLSHSVKSIVPVAQVLCCAVLSLADMIAVATRGAHVTWQELGRNQNQTF